MEEDHVLAAINFQWDFQWAATWQDVDALRKSINSGEGCRIRGVHSTVWLTLTGRLVV